MAARSRTPQERIEAAEARRARRAAVTDADVVMAAAADFLAVRSRSVAETRRRLVRLGYASGLVDEVVERLASIGYLDDTTFARAWVESRDRARPRGATALRRELVQKGIPAEVVTEVLATRGSSQARHPMAPLEAASGVEAGAPDAELAAAQRLLQKRASSLAREMDPRRRRQKAYALLARSGFSPDVCQEVAGGVVSDTDG